jgi:hypothetical protein
MECDSILYVGATLKLFSARDHEKGMEPLERIVSMLRMRPKAICIHTEKHVCVNVVVVMHVLVDVVGFFP